MSENLPAIRQEITEAQERGDVPAANEAYSRELQALAGGSQPSSEGHSSPAPAAPSPLPAEHVSAVWSELEATDPEGARQLKGQWGADAAANMGYAAAWMRANMSADEIAAAPNDPKLLAVAARMGREMVHAAPAAQPRPETTDHEAGPMTVNAETFDAGMRQFSERIERAQAEGKTRLANEIYAEQQEWIARVKGRGDIVNGRRTA